MNELLVFYGGNVIRDGPCGLDLSQCQFKVARIEGLVEISMSDLRRCIRREFDQETARKKLVIEAVTCRGHAEGSSDPLWELHKVTGNVSWAGYMRLVSTPGVAMYGRPMVYAQFVDRDEGCSATVELQVAATEGSREIVLAATEDNPMHEEEGQLISNEDAGPFWSARVDLFEVLPTMPNELDSDEEGEGESDGSEEDGGDAGGGAQRAIGEEMDELRIQNLVISRDVNSCWGFDESSLLVGQRFPTKEAAKTAITKYAVSINREYKAKRSNPQCLKLLCTQPNCPARIRASQHVGLFTDFEITVLIDHTCELSEPLTKHRNVSATYVAEKVHHVVSQDISVGPKALMATVADEVGFPVGYSMVRRAKQKVIERMFGTPPCAHAHVTSRSFYITLARMCIRCVHT